MHACRSTLEDPTKELLFHLGLAPFARAADPIAGGLLALALLDAAVAAALTWATVSALGAWGVAITFLVFGTATDFTLRMVRLRPELFSLLLFLAVVSLAARRRPLLLGVLAGVFALSYTAFHALLGLFVLFWAYGLWVERRNDWRLVVYPAVGIALGLLVHPHFPANLRVWVAQSFDFFAHAGAPDVGAEIQSRTTRDVLLLNAGWLAGLLSLWRSRTSVAPPAPDTRLRDLTLIAAVVFTLLYLSMARFVVYAVPFVTLALARTMHAAGQRPGAVVRLPWGGEASFALVMTICLAGAIPATLTGFGRLRASAPRIFEAGTRADYEAFGRALPEGAKVFAPWAASEEFVLWAPQGRYLNLLDPVFMEKNDPALHTLALDVLEGREPDIPLVAAARFDSEFFADDGQYPLARARLAGDPRAIPLHEGVTYLYRLVPDRNADFLLDWVVLPPGTPVPPPLALLTDATTPTYPRAATPEERALEGYVDGRRVGDASTCLTFGRVIRVAAPTRFVLELAPYGNADVFVDDAPVAALPPRTATLGRGVTLALAFEPGVRRLTVRTCPAGGQLGFYALVRPAGRP